MTSIASPPSPEAGAPKVADVVSPVAVAAPAPDRGEAAAAALDGRQLFFLFVGSAVAACLIFAAGVAVGRRVEQRLVAREKAPPADPLAVLDEIANAEESLTFHRAVLERPATGERPAGASVPAPAPSPAGERPTRYTLNSPTFALRPTAEDLLRRLRESGYKVKVVEAAVAGKPQYRLQIGDFPSPESAQPIRSELLGRLGLATTVAKLPTGPGGAGGGD